MLWLSKSRVDRLSDRESEDCGNSDLGCRTWLANVSPVSRPRPLGEPAYQFCSKMPLSNQGFTNNVTPEEVGDGAEAADNGTYRYDANCTVDEAWCQVESIATQWSPAFGRDTEWLAI